MNQKTPKAGFEPATKRLTVASSAAELLGIENTGQMGFEPTTSAVTGQRSKPLNYYPVKGHFTPMSLLKEFGCC